MELEATKMECEEKKNLQLNIKVTVQMRDMVSAIGVFEGISPTELVRSWIVEKVQKYRADKCFMREFDAGHLKTAKEDLAEQSEEE
jgi:hypothetical protein